MTTDGKPPAAGRALPVTGRPAPAFTGARSRGGVEVAGSVEQPEATRARAAAANAVKGTNTIVLQTRKYGRTLEPAARRGAPGLASQRDQGVDLGGPPGRDVTRQPARL